MTKVTHLDNKTVAGMDLRTREILNGPLGPLLLRLSVPNIVAMLIQTVATFAEVWFVGQLGTVALAGLALVFPMFMLMMMLSGGAVGGAVAAVMAQTLGQGGEERAGKIIWNAFYIAIFGGLIFTLIFILFGAAIYRGLGAEADVVGQALAYSDILFAGVVIIWLLNIAGGLLRGMGDMRSPAISMFIATTVQIPLGGSLILGWGPFPALGIAGVPVATLAAMSVALLFLLWTLNRETCRVPLRLRNARVDVSAMGRIFKIGAMASLSPFLSVATIIVLTALVARFSTEAIAGYGIGSRLEFLVIPIVWGIGAALTTIVGTNMGAGQLDRAHQGALLGGIASFVVAGGFGLLFAIYPELWVAWFTDDAKVTDAANTYFHIAGPFYGMQGLGLCLYFASQGAGAMNWPIIAGFARFIATVVCAWLWLSFVSLSMPALFAFIACGMTAYGVFTAIPIYFGAWRRVFERQQKGLGKI